VQDGAKFVSRLGSDRGPRYLYDRVRRPLTRLYLKLRHQVFGRRYRRLVLERVGEVPFLVLPDVFNPVLFRTGPFLAEAVARLAPAPGPGRLALDMGTGSGVGAVFAARAGYRVLAVDINAEAVRCARINVLLSRLEAQVEVRQGDLFAPVAGETFDLVLFNPPFYRGVPKDALDHAWRGVDVFERFAAGLTAALAPGGQALVVVSTDGDAAGLLRALDAQGLTHTVAAQRDLGNEVLTIHAITRTA
jgi:methylase of polypeptide subunit release factors